MKPSKKIIRIGILGCGAIGGYIAKSVSEDLRGLYKLTGLYDLDKSRMMTIQQSLHRKNLAKASYADLLRSCDLLFEAISAKNTIDYLKQAILAGKDVLCMSVGALLKNEKLFLLARRKRCNILIPSGAIAGLDAIKACSLATIDHIRLTTKKPVSGFLNDPALEKRNIDLSKIKEETVLFEGPVDEAVRTFPRNINVAATLALASQVKNKIIVRIVVSPQWTSNSHEIEVTGAFGKIWTCTENAVSPHNPKTSYLAMLSALQTLKEFSGHIQIGT